MRNIVTFTLLSFILCAWTIAKITHEDLKLPCLPADYVYFASGETDLMSDELYAKFESIINTLKKRVDEQCDLAVVHNANPMAEQVINDTDILYSGAIVKFINLTSGNSSNL